MSRHVNVCVPHEYADNISHLLYTFPHVYKIVRFNTFTTVHLSFKVQPKHLQDVIMRLGNAGCGESYGTIDVFTCLLTRPLLEVKEAGGVNKRPKYSISDRMTVDEIEDIVEDGNHLTFDYMAQIAVASIIAGVGLVTDSATVVIAAMLVSPLMGPILSITFGVAVLKKRVIWRGFRNETIGVIISFAVGIVTGFVVYGLSGTDFAPGGEIINRGRVGGLIAGSVVAAASGMGVILALSKGGVNAIVGTSISASLLPPCVNSGICLAYAICLYYLSNDQTDLSRYKQTAVVSFCLYAMNFILIIVVGILTFRYIKKIYPLSDPRNLPHNPHLSIPRSLKSEEGFSSSPSSFDAGDGSMAVMGSRFSKSSSSLPFTSTDMSEQDVESPLLDNEHHPLSCMSSGPAHEDYRIENTLDSPHIVYRRGSQSQDQLDTTEL